MLCSVEQQALFDLPGIKSVPWTLAEFRHNRMVQSPHENYFNVCRQHKKVGSHEDDNNSNFTVKYGL